MNEKLLTNVNQLPLNNPCIQLMVKDLMTAKKYLCKHILDNGIATGTLLMEGIKNLATSLALLFDFKHQVEKSWEHLEVDAKLLQECRDSQGSVFEVFPLNQ